MLSSRAEKIGVRAKKQWDGATVVDVVRGTIEIPVGAFGSGQQFLDFLEGCDPDLQGTFSKYVGWPTKSRACVNSPLLLGCLPASAAASSNIPAYFWARSNPTVCPFSFSLCSDAQLPQPHTPFRWYRCFAPVLVRPELIF